MKSSALALLAGTAKLLSRWRFPAIATSSRATISITPSSRPSGGTTPAICATAEGRRFGFELTFFRQGVDRGTEPAGVWDVRDAWLAHLALSDIDGGGFYHAERLNRSGPGLAGARSRTARVWNGNWRARGTSVRERSG